VKDLSQSRVSLGDEIQEKSVNERTAIPVYEGRLKRLKANNKAG
jgi:hypothetical protein